MAQLASAVGRRRWLRRRYERRAGHFLRLTAIAGVLVCYRRLAC
ncbi:hypothetical protein [Streptomyces sp. NPDC013489]